MKTLAAAALLFGAPLLYAQTADPYAGHVPGTSSEVQVTEPGFQVFQFPKNMIPRID